MGRGCRPHRRRSWYSTFAPFPDTLPRNQPAIAQTYATVVFGEGRVSGEQMLTVRRGLRTTATAAVHKALFQLTHCQESVRLSLQQATWALCQHCSCQHCNFVIYEARAEREARDTRTGLVAERNGRPGILGIFHSRIPRNEAGTILGNGNKSPYAIVWHC